MISVFLIAGTGRPYLVDALRSLIRQDCTDWEAIVVEACASENDTSRVYQQLNEVRDSRIRVLPYPGERGFPPFASRKWNMAASLATGTFFAFLDDDDLKEDGWLSAMSAPFLSDSELMAVVCDAIHIDGCGQKHGVLGASLDRDALLAPNFMTTGQMMIRRSVFDEIGGFDPELPCSEDYDFALHLSRYPWKNVRSVNALKREGEQNASRHDDVISFTRSALARIAITHHLGFAMFPWWTHG